MYLQPVPDVQTTITPQAIIANSLLQLSTEELEQAVNEALAENPALEAAPPQLCRRCGTPLANGSCPLCAGRSHNATIRHDDEGWWHEDSRWPSRRTSFDDDDEFDPLTLVACESTLAEYLRIQAAPLLDDTERSIAEFIIDSLDERGLLSVSVEEIATYCNCPEARVKAILSKIQSLDPPGVAARSVQECLLIQLRQIDNGNGEVGLASRMIAQCWDALTKLSLDAIARVLKAEEEDIAAAIDFISRNLNPFPANSDWRGPGPKRESNVIQPDIIVRKKRPPETGYEIEIPDSRKYRLRVSGLYQQISRDIRAGTHHASLQDREHLREHLAQARLFINCLRQRWNTLERIALLLVDVQEDFLEKGYRYLKPLTRSELADIVGVHESTVGRAVANKTVMLPNGRILPLSDFFDGSLALKCVIEEIVLEEKQSLSDQKIAEILQARGYQIARRTVAKYRDAIGIPPARVRGALKTRNWKPLWVPPEHARAF